jgi:ABC-type transport system substrate-binding protein/pSer/pThr/pTyr-binding forkhead associated (FHA) protein
MAGEIQHGCFLAYPGLGWQTFSPERPGTTGKVPVLEVAGGGHVCHIRLFTFQPSRVPSMLTPAIIFEDGQEMVFSGSERITIGREEDNNVIVDEPEMSRYHGEIILHPDGTAEVRDRGSRSGTFVNDQRVLDSVNLRDGDRVSFGPLHAVFRLKDKPPAKVTARIPLRTDAAQRDAQAALDALQARRDEMAAGLEKLTVQAAEITAKNESLRAEGASEQKKRDELRQQADEAVAKRDARLKEADEAATRLEKVTSEEKSVREGLEKLRAEAAKAEAGLKQLLSQAEEAEKRLQDKNTLAAQSETRVREAEAALKQALSKAEEAEKNAQEKSTLAAQSETRVREAEAALKQALSKAEEKQTLAAQSETRVREAEEALKQALSKAEEAVKRAQENQTLAAQSEARAREAEDSLQVFQKAVSKTEEVLGVLKVEQEQTSSRLASLAREEQEAKSRVEALQADEKAAQQGLESVRDELRALQKALEERQSALTAVEKQITELKSRETAVQGSLRDLEAVLENRRAELKTAESELEAQKGLLSEKSRELAVLKKELEEAGSARERLQALSEEQNRLESALRDLKRYQTTAEEQLSATQQQLEKERGELAELRAQSAEAESDLVTLLAEKQSTATHSIQPKNSRATIVLRLFLLLTPVTVLALAWWAAEQSRRARALPPGRSLVAMLAEEKPALHPFAPQNEAERQIIDLVHEPLMRIGVNGALEPALAELWRWSQDVTCWFGSEEAARKAQELLQGQLAENNVWARWHLSTARVVGSSLVMNFTDPTHAGTPQALEVIGPLQPQVLEFWRFDSPRSMREPMRRFLNEAELAGQVRRVWYESDQAVEIVAAGPTRQLVDELRRALSEGAQSAVQARLIGETAALSEPVLDLDMRHGRTWHDGTPVTAEDARVTIEEVGRRPWLLPNREALRHIQAMEVQNGGMRLHVVFRSRYGPALCGWADLPVLPSAWWQMHRGMKDEVFTDHPPPGAGPFRLSTLDARTLALLPVDDRRGEAANVVLHFSASPLMTQIGLATRTAHLVWPAQSVMDDPDLRPCLTPPHRRLVVLWNTRKGPLRDVRVRQALAEFTHVPSVIQTIHGVHTVADASLFPPGMWLHTKAARATYAPQQARKRLADAGWLPGVDGVLRDANEKLVFFLLVLQGDAAMETTARELAAQWKVMGAEVAVTRVTRPDELAQRLAERAFDAVLVEQRFEVSWDQFPWWHSSQARPGGTNFSGIEDPQTDVLLEALATEFEPAAAADRVRKLEARLLPLHPMLTLYTTVDAAAVHESLTGGKPLNAWTLRQLALRDEKPANAAPEPKFDLKLPTE